MKSRMIPAALSFALASIGISCSTEPQELSPVTGQWVSLAEPGAPALLELALLADDAGEIFGTCTLAAIDTRVPCVVQGDYIHPDLELTISRGESTYGEYAGERVDNNTIDGNLSSSDEVVALRLKRKRYAEEAGL